VQYIFVHGIGQIASSWEKTISFLAKPFDIECMELSVYLNNKESTYTNLYRSFSEYCDSIQKPINLCGLSLGGVLALHYTIDNPTKVNSLVLIGAQYKANKMLLKIQNVINQFMPQSAFQSAGFQKKNYIKFIKSMADLDLSSELSGVKCPVLIVCGAKDSVNKKASKSLAENISNAEFYLVENASHEVNISNPQVLASKLDAFYGTL
jgi:pimeloyl-ACP methyl ester carboxylesterase